MTKFYHLERNLILREGLQRLSLINPNLFSVGHSDEKQDFFNTIKTTHIDVVVIDQELESNSGHSLQNILELCSTIHHNYPNISIVLQTYSTKAYWVNQLIDAGVKGFVSIYSGMEDFQQAISTVSTGAYYCCPVIARMFSNYKAFMQDPSIKLKLVELPFTSRELAVLENIGRGNSTKTIAQILHVSEKTIETHRCNLLHKAKVKNTAELMRFASSKGLLF